MHARIAQTGFALIMMMAIVGCSASGANERGACVPVTSETYTSVAFRLGGAVDGLDVLAYRASSSDSGCLRSCQDAERSVAERAEESPRQLAARPASVTPKATDGEGRRTLAGEEQHAAGETTPQRDREAVGMLLTSRTSLMVPRGMVAGIGETSS